MTSRAAAGRALDAAKSVLPRVHKVWQTFLSAVYCTDRNVCATLPGMPAYAEGYGGQALVPPIVALQVPSQKSPVLV